jgi:hypothetical protein
MPPNIKHPNTPKTAPKTANSKNLSANPNNHATKKFTKNTKTKNQETGAHAQNLRAAPAPDAMPKGGTSRTTNLTQQLSAPSQQEQQERYQNFHHPLLIAQSQHDPVSYQPTTNQHFEQCTVHHQYPLHHTNDLH